jgi:hypothetical protein
MELGLQ